MLDKEEARKRLALKHYSLEPGITHIFTLWGTPEYETRPGEPIKLLEVNTNTVPSGVMPLHFGPVPASGVPFPSVIVEVTPAEFERIKSSELKLPKDWRLGDELPKPTVGEAEFF